MVKIRQHIHESRRKQDFIILRVYFAHVVEIKRWCEVDYRLKAVAEVR